MRTNTWLLPVASTLLLAVLAGCSQNPLGIFESIEIERAILDDRNLNNELNVASISKAGTNYFVAAGALLYRSTTDADYLADDRAQWESAPAPGSGTDNFTTTSLVTADLGSGERVYAVFRNQTATDFRLLEINPASPETEGTVILETGDTVSGDEVQSLGDLFGLDEDLDGTVDALLVSTELTGGVEYTLVETRDASTFAQISGTEASNSPYVDAFSTGLGNIYLDAQRVLFDDDFLVGANAAAAQSSGRENPAAFTGGIYDTDGTLTWLADDSGYLYSSANNTSWTRSDQIDVNTTSSSALAFTDFAELPIGNPISSRVLVVGTRGDGYRIVGTTGGGLTAANAAIQDSDDNSKYTLDTPVETDSNYEASDLSGAAINSFYVDPVFQNAFVPTPDGDPYEELSGYVFFAGTTNAGLWRSLSYSGAAQWIQE